MSLFNYILKPVEQCALSEASSTRKSMAWFWLTDSNNYIQIGDVKLFESSTEWQIKYNEGCPFLDYQYVRFLEDFFGILPQISIKMPVEIYQYINTAGKYKHLKQKLIDWYGGIDEPTKEQEKVEDDIMRLLWFCRLDTGHLAYKSRCCFYRVGDIVGIHYDFKDHEEDGTPVWSADCGQYELSYQIFIDEVEDLLVRFFRDMDTQVDNAITLLLHHQNYVAYDALRAQDERRGTFKSGIDYLKEEHAQRKKDFWGILHRVRHGSNLDSVSWDEIKESVEFLLSRSK